MGVPLGYFIWTTLWSGLEGKKWIY